MSQPASSSTPGLRFDAWSEPLTTAPRPTHAFSRIVSGVCVKNEGYAVSLELRKLYVTLPDAQAAKHKQVRVVDESGEDYLYPREFFVAVELPRALRRRVLQAA